MLGNQKPLRLIRFDPFLTLDTHVPAAIAALSISYGLVEQHGGRLSARNREQRAECWMELPLLAEGNSAATQQRQRMFYSLAQRLQKA